MNVTDLFRSFQTQEQAVEYLEAVRWGGEPICPYCASNSVGRHASGDRKMPRWQCRSCTRAFAVTVGTPFHGTHIPLRDWFLVMAQMLNSEQSVSTRQISRDLEIRRPTIASMVRRLNSAIEADSEQHKLMNRIVRYEDGKVK